MVFLSMNDPDFWGNSPKELEAIVRAGGNEGVLTSYFLLGDKGDNPPLAAPLQMKPGYVLPRHAHDCYRFEVVVQGSMDVGGRILRAGDVMITEPGTLYGPHIAGSEGCSTVEIFSNFAGAHRLMLESDSGELVRYDMSAPENAPAIVEKTKEKQRDAVSDT